MTSPGKTLDLDGMEGNGSSQSQPRTGSVPLPVGEAESSAAFAPDVGAIIRGLTPVQRGFVRDGCLHGDVTMTTVRALRAKAMFYHHIDSPNGRCGPMLLTPLGKTVQAELRARDLAAKALGEQPL